jgi:lipopolysaccharide export system permease protein
MWFFNRYSQLLHRGYGVTVSELDNRRRETRRLMAAEATLGTHGEGWIFKDGRDLTFDPDTGELVSTEPFAVKAMKAYHEDPKLMLLVVSRAAPTD